MLAIKNNLMAANAARHLGQNYEALSKSVERLSSGLRINSAKDDAAGMAVSELVRADVAQLQQGSRNAQDAISMLQTAEGALGADDDILVRMKELAQQASTGSYSSGQRTIMNNEFQQLGAELTRIANSTQFNQISLLNNSNTYSFNVGSTDTIDLAAQDMQAAGASLNLGSTGSAASATFNLGTANPNLTGFVVGKAGGGTLDVNFATGAHITVNFTAATSYSLNEVVNMTNTAAGYNAASTVYNASTNQYSLKIVNSAIGVHAPTTTASTQTGMTAAGDFTDSNGTAGAAVSIDGADGTNATNALTSLTSAISNKDLYRAKLGYMMNRLQSAVNVVNIQAENLQSAQSRISDVDTATETAALTRNQVLAQAGIAMLAQANSMPQMALKLLG
jgi:flagellin